MTNPSIQSIVEKCLDETPIDDDETASLLACKNPEDQELIFKAARDLRHRYFNNHIFMYGFAYFSTHCQNNCTFCYYRRDNQQFPRYRKTPEEIVDTAIAFKNSGVHLIDLTTGDDPYYTTHPERLGEIIAAVKAASGLSVMVSPGVLDAHGLSCIAKAGADWYALYQETYNRRLFQNLRIEQGFDDRIASKKKAASLGLLLEEGLLTGFGDTLSDRVDALRRMQTLSPSQMRIMTFIPQDGAPLIRKSDEGFLPEIMTIAVMRLMNPDVLIPASLDVDGIDGLKQRLMAGANVVTSIIPPREGYAGVANSVRDIDEGHRTAAFVKKILGECGLRAASEPACRRWIEERRNKQ
jgi:methylornithine synthase